MPQYRVRMLRSVLMAVVLGGCAQEYEQAPAPLPPTGRIEPGLLACAGLGGCDRLELEVAV